MDRGRLASKHASLPCGKPHATPIGGFRTTNTVQHQFQIDFLQRYWMTTASRCGEPHNYSPHLQRFEPHPASLRRIGSYSGTVRRGYAPVPHVKHWPTTERRLLRTTSLDEPSHSSPFYSQTGIWPPCLPQDSSFVTAALLESQWRTCRFLSHPEKPQCRLFSPAWNIWLAYLK
jgi:hypothetical protein